MVQKKTLGIMLPGEYEFSTSVKEEMEFVGGTLEYKLQGQDWQKNRGERHILCACKRDISIEGLYCC
ncbi:hypothetical protein GCM10020331_051390 [Ectobacillus funiculus]